MVEDNGNQNEDVKRTFARWLFGQEANTVALFLILGAFGWGCYYALTTAVPEHLKQIQSGYESINDENNKARSEDRVIFDKTLDRMEKAYNSRGGQ